jgi:trans-AT polyketide synthase/acyltransferase/oxidoreductase domain-containing protein
LNLLAPHAPPARAPRIDPAQLGSAAFIAAHGLRYAYAAGAMGKGIASADWVIRLARARILSFFGAGGLTLARTAEAIRAIRAAVPADADGEPPWGVNFLHTPIAPGYEDGLADLLLAEGVRRIEASAFIRVTPALVRYRLAGLTRGPDGRVRPANRILAKLSRPEVARQFLAPPDPAIVAALYQSGRISDAARDLAAHIPLADDICAEADSGGHTDRRVALTLVPHFRRMREEEAARNPLAAGVRIGAAGGIGTPEAVAAAFMLGADFVLTGSINQCTPEAGISDTAKDMLAAADLADFDIAPAGDMFEIGARVQVLRRGTLFAARANRLYEIYRAHAGLHEIQAATLAEIEQRYLGRSIAEVWRETKAYYAAAAPAELAEAEANPRKKMAMVFRWYFIHATRLARDGRPEDRINFQIHSGPAMGALNRWLRGSDLEDWRARHPDLLADRLMQGAASLFGERLAALLGAPTPPAASPP